MNDTQKIIKYCAIGFGIFLIVNIFSAIMVGIASLGIFFDGDFGFKRDAYLEEAKGISIKGTNFRELEIDAAAVSVEIRSSDSFRVETNNKYIKVREYSDKLKIEEAGYSFFRNGSSRETFLTVYIPEGMVFDEVSIDTGAGKMSIEELEARDISFDLGAGKLEIEKLVATHKLDIDGGAGEINILDGSINDLDLDMGVGSVTIQALVTGYSEIDAGVGNCELRLLGNEEDYRIKINKGIGEATIDGKAVSNDTYYGNGNSRISIDGGVGRINVSFLSVN